LGLSFGSRAADKLRITTVPPGATVQINGVLVGITPYEQSIPGGYLHKAKTALGARLGYPMIARLTLEGRSNLAAPQRLDFPLLAIAATQCGVLASAGLAARGGQSTEEQTTASLVLRPAGVR
jgi:hypothetical protein